MVPVQLSKMASGLCRRVAAIFSNSGLERLMTSGDLSAHKTQTTLDL